jgi:DNA primase
VKVVHVSIGRIPEEVIETIRTHHDIVEVVGRYVHLRKSGRNHTGLCPFHSEKTPSFSVNQEKQMFYCFGCGVGGNVITFLMEMESYSFVEAVKQLAEEAHIAIPETTAYTDPEKNSEKDQMLKAHELTAKWFQHVLLHTNYGHKASSYLKNRGFTDETIQTFQIGYSPPSWDALTQFLQKRGFPLPLMEAAGLLSGKSDGRGYVDRFRDRIMFPIFDSQGKVIAFGGRVIDSNQQPKYLNSPETLLFNKSRNLYNLHLARGVIRKKQQAILFEGYVDVISAYQVGIHNGVATLGTSLTDDHAKILRRNAEQVILCFDADDAGQSAAYRGLDLLVNSGCMVKVATMPKNIDPDDYIRQYGAEKFNQEVMGGAISLTAFKLRHLRKSFDLTDEQSRLRYVHEAMIVISALQHPIERDHYLRQLSEEFKLSLDSLKQEQKQVAYKQKKEKSGDKPSKPWNTNINNGKKFVKSSPLLPAFQNAERTLIGYMMQDASVCEQVKSELGDQFNVDEYAALSAFLYAFYGEHNEANPSRFIHSLQDEKLIRLATSLSMAELNPNPSHKEIADMIRRIQDQPKWIEIERKKEEKLKAERSGDAIRAATIGQEIILLQKRLKSM